MMEYFFKRATAGRDLNLPEDKKKIEEKKAAE